jgi:cytochrome c oxidase subunit 3
VKADEIYADPLARGHALHLGVWVFLGSETLLFAGLFAVYSAYRSIHDFEFATAVAHNDVIAGSVNTLVLIISSFFVAWSIHAIRGGRRRACLLALGAAMLLGLAFLGIKTFEYSHHLAEGIAPGAYYSSTALPSRGAQLFFTLYYLMTGLHAIHVIAGLVILTWMAVRVWRFRTTQVHHIELELGGLYWHLVDIVWIFLWPLLYLTRHP